MVTLYHPRTYPETVEPLEVLYPDLPEIERWTHLNMADAEAFCLLDPYPYGGWSIEKVVSPWVIWRPA